MVGITFMVFITFMGDTIAGLVAKNMTGSLPLKNL